MSIDIMELDLLPEIDPISTADLDEMGLQVCRPTCLFNSCFFTKDFYF